MYRDFLGGWDKMIEKSYELMGRTFDTMDYDFRGGYDFRFTVQGNNDYEEDNTTFVDCPVESDGKVTLITDGLTHLLSKVEENEELWWEVESEIRGVIDDILYREVTKKTGIMVDVNNVLDKGMKIIITENQYKILLESNTESMQNVIDIAFKSLKENVEDGFF